MFSAGDNFVVSPVAIDKIHFSPPFQQQQQQQKTDSNYYPSIHRPGYRIVALSAAGSYAASLWSAAAAHGSGGGVQQTITISEVDISRGLVHELWTAPLPQQLYMPDSAFLQAVARRPGEDDDDEGGGHESAAQLQAQKQHPDMGVVMSIEHGGNGAVVVGWASTDVIAIVEPPQNNEAGGAIVICKKRVEHPPVCIVIGSELVFTVSGPSGRLQSWQRKTGEINRDGGILSSLHRVSSLAYEPSEALLLVGFEAGVVRLVSVERNAPLVTLCTIDVAAQLFGGKGTVSVLCVSTAQRATGDVVVTTSAGFALLNLRTQQLAKARFSFAENGVAAGTPSASFATASTTSEFIVLCGGSGPTVSVVPCGLLLERFNAMRSSPSSSFATTAAAAAAQQHRAGASDAKWAQRPQVNDAAALAVHDDMSDISIISFDDDDDLSSLATNDAIRPFSAGGWGGAMMSPSNFSIAQHSNVSYNEQLREDEEEDDDDDDENDEEMFIREDEEDEGGVIAEEPSPLPVAKPAAAPAAQWKHPPKLAAGAKKLLAPAPGPAATKRSPAAKPGAKSAAALPVAVAAATPATTTTPDVILLEGNPLCMLPTHQSKYEQLPAPLREPFLVAQVDKADPAAKPVTFNRGGPVKSSGYAASSSVPWSVQQAEKNKRKKAQQLAAKKASQPPAPATVQNYNTACGATTVEHEAATKVFDKQAVIHASAVTAAGFDVAGNVFFTGSNDGTCHALRLPVLKHEGQGFALNGSLLTGAVVSPSVSSPREGLSGSRASVAASASGAGAPAATAAAPAGASGTSPASLTPVLSLDVGVSTTRSAATTAGPSSFSWNLFASSCVGGGVTIWAPSAQSGAAPRIRHNFARDVRAVRLCLRDTLLLAASGSTISVCRFALDSGLGSKDELHRGRNLSKFAVVHECTPSTNGAQSVLSMDTFNAFDSAAVVFGTSSKQVGLLDLRRPDAGAVWAVDDAHQRPVHSVALQRSSSFAFDPVGGGPDSQQALCVFASASVDNSVRLWDLRTRSAVRVLNKHVNTAMQLGLCLSPCSRYVACGSEDRSVVIYDLGQGTIVSKMRVPDNATVLRYHPLKTQLMAGLANGKARMFVEQQQLALGGDQ